MPNSNRAQIVRQIQTAEGYLDLAMVFEDRWPLDPVLRRKMSDRAINCLEKIVQPLGHKPYILFLKGQSHRAANRYRQAISFFKQSSKLDPDNVHTLLALAWCQKRIDRVDQAIETLTSALSIDASSAIVQYNLACYWSLSENVELAVLHLENALDLNPDYRSHVTKEADFDPIRDNESFRSAINIHA